MNSSDNMANVGKDITPISSPLKMSYLNTETVNGFAHETILDRLKQHAKTSPDKEVLVIVDVDPAHRKSVSFKECDDLSDKLADGLIRIGVGIEDVVAILMPNCTEFLVSWVATLKCHAHPAFVSFNMKHGEDLKHILKNLKVVGVILHTGKSDEYYEIIKAVFDKYLATKHDPDIPALKFVIALGNRPLDGAINYENMVHTTKQPKSEVLIERIKTVDIHSPCVIFQTSGSTGRPKHVVHRHLGVVNNVIFMVNRLQASENARYFCDRPLTWSGGFKGLLAACITGLTAVTIDSTISVAKRDVHSILQIISREKCTTGLLMPYMLYDIDKLQSIDEYKLDALKNLITGGQRIPDVLIEGVRNKLPNVDICIVYGSTETSLISTQFSNADLRIEEAQKGTVGYPLPGYEIKITDENDQLVPVGTPGNIKVKTIHMFTKYFNDVEKTNEKLIHGWFNLEDFGYLTENGYIVFACRKSDLIKRGTVLVAPTTIENVILNHTSVNKVIVVGVPDPRLYEELCACVVLHPGKAMTEEDVIDYCNGNFTEQTLDGLSLTPKYVLMLEDFPKLANGKADKITLRKMAAERFDEGRINNNFH